ncbi:hypothetical protein EVAR_97732_1 [Eumeta japonica]|uniref:Uncharacterized protein n=1 Tax=Eumeta variegata TaxID=151549 RepID=A0A4C1X859_EUMVA|nr:hypothetical protein EVAR_97732_1 [Eumeta japonica]
MTTVLLQGPFNISPITFADGQADGKQMARERTIPAGRGISPSIVIAGRRRPRHGRPLETLTAPIRLSATGKAPNRGRPFALYCQCLIEGFVVRLRAR